MSKKLKIFIPIYILFLVLIFLYVRSVLNQTPLSTQGDEKKIQEIYPINVSLKFINNENIKTYTAPFNSSDTITDLMETMRDHQGIIYEKTEYRDKTIIDSVNGITAPVGYMWGVFSGDTNYTNVMGTTPLLNNTTYELKIVKE